MKVAIIRCLKKEDECIAKPCLDLIKERKKKFKDLKEIELVGMVTCGGCPGKGISIRAQKLIDEGADKIILTSCITDSSCRDAPCPYLDTIKSSLSNIIEERKIIFSTI
ncbi:CGGC domain-containing protein [Acetohalobium arabaticum]|uniref:CGGC domain-containing protein n=1 Tax=Acetohalobium arabaticum (strain ATCC 49924 / DSM 5501 / Z-7288) TaxID=574087 RepID=D9QUH4_ACEAZ|nr:CGGC domain-containing protein [Acetohalobium arabaticum]ADL13775.1 Protein of unknown function CGGC region [Acetohalobium arabaticum DSM 5501]